MTRLLLAFLRRDLLVETSYRFALLWHAGGALFTLLIFFHLAKLVDPASGSGPLSAYGAGYFGFALVGIALSPLLSGGLVAVADRVRREQLEGTLETLFAAGPSPLALAAGLAAFDLLRTLVAALLVLAAGLLLFRAPVAPDPPALLLLLALALAVAAGLSLLSAGFVLRHQRGDPVASALSLAQEFLGGVYFPVELLGPSLTPLSAALPMTHLLSGFRKALYLGPRADIAPECLALALFAAILLPAGAGFFLASVRAAKRSGALAKY